MDVLDLSQIAPERARPLRRAEYDQLVELGHFEDERVELLHGVMVSMSPQGTRHSDVPRRLIMLLAPALSGRALVQAHSPFAASEDSEPEPDLAVVPLGDYRREHPRQAFLVVEVAESSLRKDRHVKAPLYAACGVPEYWLVNLVDGVVEVHAEPVAGRYSRVVRCGPGDTLALRAFPDMVVRVGDFLG